MNEVRMAAELRGSFLESVLLQINEQGGSVRPSELDDFTGDRGATVEVITALNERGLAQKPSTAGCSLTPFGLRTAARIKDSLLSGPRRADAVQRALLEWLNGQGEAGPSSIEEFLTLPEAVAMGEPMMPLEVEHAAELLLERGFIAVAGTFGPSLARPEITPDGRAALMSDVMISDYGRANPTMINYDYSNKVSFGDHANAAGVIAGDKNQQTVVQVIGPAERAELATRVSALLKLAEELPEDADSSELSGVLEALAGEVDHEQPRAEVVKDLVLKATGAAVGVLGSAAGQQLLEGISQVAHLIQ